MCYGSFVTWIVLFPSTTLFFKTLPMSLLVARLKQIQRKFLRHVILASFVSYHHHDHSPSQACFLLAKYYGHIANVFFLVNLLPAQIYCIPRFASFIRSYPLPITFCVLCSLPIIISTPPSFDQCVLLIYTFYVYFLSSSHVFLATVFHTLITYNLYNSFHLFYFNIVFFYLEEEGSSYYVYYNNTNYYYTTRSLEKTK